MTLADVVAGLVILVGLVGIVLPVLPGTLLIAVALVGWAIAVGGSTAWTVTGIGLAVLAVGTVVMYLVPGRRLKAAGVPGRTILIGVAAGVVGFFVIPVIGLLLGFVAGVYIAESARLGPDRAWPSTKHALLAVGLSIAIELTAGLLATAVWVYGVVRT